MFRTQQNPMDDAVVRATDETLTSEDWATILDVCDRVSASTSGPQQAVSSMIKRLAHRNANVQLYTLELANALSQNCGAELHRELASKAFTDALLRLAADRNTHAQVKQKVLERMSTWADEFARTPELGIMEQAYQKLRVQQPGLMPPSKPVKKEISTEDRRKEDEELQMALALSIKDKGTAGQAQQSGGRDDSEQQPAQQAQGSAPSQGTTAATVSRVRALYDFTPSEAGELAFKKNDIIAVLESVYKDWWKGSLRGQTGIFPLNYVEKLQDPTKEELERDAQMEGEVFGEIKNVEKLLALLSVGGEGGRRGEREEEEISELYQRTLSIRPKLIELIGRYSQKKDDFTQLNEKFIKARRDYEALLESSMSQTPYQQQYPVRPRQAPYAQHPQYPQQPPRQAYPQQQGPPPSVQAGYPPQQPYAQASQPHLNPIQSPQDPQSFYAATPSEPPGRQQGYANAYHQQDGPPSGLPSNGPAPFHIIPGGVLPPSAPQEVRRKPSPQTLASQGSNSAYPPGQGFQGQIRPNSIHTLNSGNPQELATGGYESPIDNRHSYPSAQNMAPVAGQASAPYDAYAQQQQQPPHQYQQQQQQPPRQHQQQQHPSAPSPPRTDRDALPSRQRTQSFESPSTFYAPSQPQQPPPGPPESAAAPQQYQIYNPDPPENQHAPPSIQQQQQQPSAPPPGVPGSPDDVSVVQHAPYAQQAYQAYRPQQQEARAPTAEFDGHPLDFYR